MQEVICVHIGQAGIQISNAAWELFCVEHSIEANGLMRDSLGDEDSQAFRTFFNEAPNGQYVPRAISVDLEPSVIDEIRTGSYRNLFHPDQLLNLFDDGSNNYARAHFTVGKKFIDSPMNVLRRMTESCDNLEGFFILHSHGGGTGSGFTSLVLEGLNIEFMKSLRFQFSVFPSTDLSSAIVEPYNTVLLSDNDINNSDITNLFSNEAIFNICTNMLSLSRPTFSNINRVLSHGFSDLTVSLRFESLLSSNFSQLGTNLIPFPRIHFPLMSYAPLASEFKMDHDSSTTQNITRSVFQDVNQLITCDSSQGQYMCCVLQYRGDVCPKDANEAIFEIKRSQTIKFVDWCPTGFKLGINSQPSAFVSGSEMGQSSRSVTMIANTTAIQEPIEKILLKFDKLLMKRSFVHWFVGEGMEEGEFNEARDSMAGLILDFIEISSSEEPIQDGDIVHTVDKPEEKLLTSADEKLLSGDAEEEENDDEEEPSDKMVKLEIKSNKSSEKRESQSEEESDTELTD